MLLFYDFVVIAFLQNTSLCRNVLNIPLNTKNVISEMFFPANLLA